MSKKTEQLTDLVTELLQEEEAELYWLDWSKKGPNWTLAVYIQQEGGISTADCARISKALSSKLDSSGLINRKYFLEVSSPGAERPLKNEKHYQGALNEKIKVSTYWPIDEKKTHTGILTKFAHNQDQGEEHIVLEEEDSTCLIPLEAIAQASTEPEFNL